jgi:PBP1b-binding outer membrane lipoprotein LpoB
MKKKLLVLTALTVMVVGCTAQPSVDKVTAPVETIPAKTSVEAYFDAVITSFPNSINIHGRKWVVDFGSIACDAIDEGMSLTDLAKMMPSNADLPFVGYMIRQAITHICPHNQWFLDAAANA